jgi:DNA-binding NtrC family response regulator
MKVQPERKTILVVNDELVLREFIGAVLKQNQYHVVTASNGHEALKFCRRADAQITAAIVDLLMPDIGRDKLLPILKTIHPNARVLLTTGFSEEIARDICQEPDAYFLQKPFTVKELIAAVEKMLERLTPPVKSAGAA